ncbi:GntR family transcriptional regulator [Roseovarius aquimarinus]|uniref:GntR family transcriptional regulator n=1 Tax=Roseovarius aquimarinus TaxID=1229156 RepID=A0ABW7I2H5_9RHOB
MTSQRETTVDQAYAALRAELTSFGLKPGARLNESALAADLGMSRAPIREALNRLIPDGLVRFEPGRGFFCRKLSAREITELYQLRFDLEAGALGAAIDHAAPEDLAAFAEGWRPDAVDADTLVAADEAFHLALARLGGNTARIDFLENINDRIRFVRRINLESDARRASALEEHARLVSALLARDRPAALAILSQHLERSAAEVQGQVRAALAQIYEGDIA